MSTGTRGVRAGRGRRPAAEVRAAALGAAGELLFQAGISAVTYERVATLAAVSKTTLYKWWPSAGAMAVDAYFERSAESLAMPDTGDLEADLKNQLHRFVELMVDTDAGRAVRGLFAAAQVDAAVREAFADRFVRPRREIGGEALTRAQRRGELRDDVDVQVLVDQLWGACYFRFLSGADAITTAYTDQLVDNALRGVRPT